MDNEQRDLSCGENQNIEKNKKVFRTIYIEIHDLIIQIHAFPKK